MTLIDSKSYYKVKNARLTKSFHLAPFFGIGDKKSGKLSILQTVHLFRCQKNGLLCNISGAILTKLLKQSKATGDVEIR